MAIPMVCFGRQCWPSVLLYGKNILKNATTLNRLGYVPFALRVLSASAVYCDLMDFFLFF